VLGNLALTIGLGYAALWLARLALLRPHRRLADRSPERPWVRLPLLALAAVLDLAPIAVFAATAYLTLGALSPLPTTRLVALAWFHAIILVHLAQVLARAVFAAGTPTLRLSQLGDAAARQGETGCGASRSSACTAISASRQADSWDCRTSDSMP
jgi:hypothetical protein